jgi:four helix bundle protein
MSLVLTLVCPAKPIPDRRPEVAVVVVKGYRDLLVWQRAMDFVAECYKFSGRFPKTEIYGLCSQLRRSAVSIPANIAEGHGRESIKEYLNHLSIAYASLMESETHVQIAERLEYIDREMVERLLTHSAEVGRMLNGLMKSLRAKLNDPP